MIAGSMIFRPAAALSITPATNTSAPRRPVMPHNVHAKVRMRIAGTIALTPSGIQDIASEKLILFLAM